MARSTAELSAVAAPHKRYYLQVELKPVDGTGLEWCDISRFYPYEHSVSGQEYGDAGVNKVQSITGITIGAEGRTQIYSASPITMLIDNSDGFFNRTKNVVLHRSQNRTVIFKSLYRSYVRITYVPLDDIGEEVVLGIWYIEDLKTNYKSKVAKMKCAPMHKRFMNTSAEDVKVGKSWLRQQPASFLAYKLAYRAIPDPSIIDASAFPGVVKLPVRPGWSAINTYGRQPEYIDGTEIISSPYIVLYAVEDDVDNSLMWLSVVDTETYTPKILLFDSATGKCELKFAESTRRGYVQLVPAGNYIYVCMVYNTTNDFTHIVNREGWYRQHLKSDMSQTASWHGNMIAGCDQWRRSTTAYNNYERIGFTDAGVSSPYGEREVIAFPQSILAYLYTGMFAGTRNRIWTLDSLQSAYSDTVGPGEEYKSTKYPRDDTGWASLSNPPPGEYLSWTHHVPFGLNIKFDYAKDYCAWWRWNSTSDTWQYYYVTLSSPTVINGPYSVNFGDSSANALWTTQVSNWCLHGQYMVVAVMNFKRHGGAYTAIAHETRIYRFLLSGTNPGTAIYTNTPPSEGEPLYTIIQMEAAGSYIYGCVLNRYNKTFGLFKMTSTGGGGEFFASASFFWPISSAPFTGFRYSAGEGVYFIDNATGVLWLWDWPGIGCSVVADGIQIDDADRWLAGAHVAFMNGNPSGVSAPGSSYHVFPQFPDTGKPDYSPQGSYALWSVEDYVNITVPVADFDGMKVFKALEKILQACGPNYIMGQDTDGYFYMKARSTTPEFTYVLYDEEHAAWEDGVLAIDDLECGFVDEESIANHITVVPFRKEDSTADGKLRLVPRNTDIKPKLKISASCDKDYGVKVSLTCVRDGHLGSQDQYSSAWDTRALFEWTLDSVEIVTELTTQAGHTYSYVYVLGIKQTSPPMNDKREINGAVVSVGDYIVAGDGNVNPIISFSGSQIAFTGTIGGSAEILPAGTSVHIMPRDSGTSRNSQDGVTTLYANIVGAGTNVKLNPTFAVHEGDVLVVEGEYILVGYVEQYEDYTYCMYCTRGYMDTVATGRPAGAPVGVLLHPVNRIAWEIGDTGITLNLQWDDSIDMKERRFKVGDRVELESTGIQAVPYPLKTATAENAQSVLEHGPYDLKIGKNPFIGPAQAPHVAWAYLQAMQYPRRSVSLVTNLDVWLQPDMIVNVKSPYYFPDETNNTIACEIRKIRHDFKNNTTAVSLVSLSAAAKDAGAGTGGGIL